MHNVIQQSQTGKKTRGVFCFRLLVGFLIYLLGGFPTLVFALPQDGQIVSGNATIDTSGDDMVIHQGSDKLITNWQSFSIGSGESVEFKQPSASSIALNNVIGLSPSVILGSLKANGQVFLSNGSGIIFGQSAQINVGGLLATTLNIKNEDFLSGNYNFTQDSSRPLSSVINRGLIEASYVGLLGPGVENTGTIVANLGSVGMASGKAASLDFVGDGLINFAITEAVDGDVLDDEGNVIDHRVKNAGLIQADGGRVVLSAKDAGNIIQNVVNNEGIIEAHSAVEKNGEIFLMGGDSGVVANSGTLDASGKDSGETGGTVHMVGEKVGIFDEGVVDVSGNAGGGTALIGGDVQGGGGVQTASNTYVSEDAVITADAIENGDGGKVVVWADDTTRIYGSVSATGGALSGNGGFVETSGKNFLQITRAADVTAAFGLGGEWLIDPRDITIDVAGSGSTGINGSNPFVSTGDSSILGVDLIIAALTGGANVTITTGSDGTQAGDITLNADLDFNGTGANTLSFIAHNDIILNNSILDSSAGGDTLNLVFTADSDLSGSGTLVVGVVASVDSQGGSMQVTARDVEIQGTMNAGAGDVTISIAQQVAGTGEIQIGDAAFCPTCAMVITGQELQNITAANLTIENTTDKIFIDNITAANSDNVGTVILNASGDIEFGRDALDEIGSTFNALQVVGDQEVLVREDLITDVGDMILTADVDGTGGAEEQLRIRSSPDLIAAGDLTLNGSSSTSVGIFSTGTNNMTAGGTITINDDFQGSSISTLTANNGVIFNADFSNAEVYVNGDANSSVDGIDQIVFADGVTLEAYSTTGFMSLTRSEALGSVTLLSGGGIELLEDFTAHGAVTINADASPNNGTGTFIVASGATLDTNGNTLNLTAMDIDLQGAVDVGSGDFAITVSQPVGSPGSENLIALGDATLCPTCQMQISGSDLQNITAGTLTIENTSQIIVVNGITAANSNNIGTVILATERHIRFEGNGSTFNALTVNAKTEIEVRVSLTTDVGDLILTADTDGSGGTDRISISSAPTLTSAGDLTLNSSPAGINTSGSVTLHAGGTLNINDQFNATGSATFTANDGINVNGDLTAGVIALNGDFNSSVDGNDTITLAAGIAVTSTTGSTSFSSAASALGGINVLAANGINVNGAFTSAGVTVFNADSDTNGSGTFGVGATGSVVTNNNTLSITARDVDLQGTLNAGASDIVLGISGTGQMMLGDSVFCPTCAMQISGAELQNITAGTLTLNNAADATFVDNITAVNSNNIGEVILTSARHISFRNNASTFNALTVNAKTEIEVRVSLTTDVGDLILTADTDGSGGTDRISISSAPTLTSAGDLTLNSSPAGINTSGSVTLHAGGTLNINDQFNATGSATFTANDGINVNGDLTAGVIALNGDFNSSVDGNDTITLAAGIAVTSTTGSTSFSSAASALGGINVLAANGINVNGAFTSAGVTVFNADSGTNGSGTFGVGATGSVVTNNNTLSITADDIDLLGTLNAGLSDITILVSDNGTVGLGNTAGDMTVSGAELQNMTAANLVLGSATNGNITVDGITALNSDNVGTVTLNSGGDIDFSNNDSTFNVLTANANANVNVRVDLESDTGDMILNADVDSSGGLEGLYIQLDPTLTSAGNLVLSASSNGNDIDVDGAVTVVATDAITLSNDFVSSGNVSLTGAGGINVNGFFTSDGSATLNADSDINVAGDLTASSNLTFGGAGTAIFVDNAIITSANGSLAMNKVVGLGAITFNAAGDIDVNGIFTSLGVTVFNADSDTSGSGTFGVGASGSVVTNNNTLSITARDVNLQGTLNAGASDIVLGISGTGQMMLGDSVFCPTCPMQISGAELQNITAGTLTLNNAADAIFVDNITTANSNNIGEVILTSARHISFRNNASTFNALTVNAKTEIEVRVSLTTDVGDLVLSADTDGSGGTDKISILSAPTLTSAGDLTLNSSIAGINANGSATFFAAGTLNINDDFTGTSAAIFTADNGINVNGNVTTTGELTLNGNLNGLVDGNDKVTFAAGISIESTTGQVGLDSAVSALGTITVLAANGIDVNGDFTATGNIILNGDSNSSVDGNDTINLASGITVESTAGSVSLSSAASALGGINVLAASGIDVNGAFASAGATVFNADTDANGNGTFAVGATSSVVTNNNTLSITADDIDLLGTLNAGLSDITILVSDNGMVGLGNTAGDMTVSGAELQNMTAANLILGSTTNGEVIVDGISAANSDNIGTVTLNSGSNIFFNNNNSVFNSLNANAVNDINVNTNLETDTGSFTAVADVELNNVGDFNLGLGTTLTSAVDIDITAENANLSGSMIAGGTITVNGGVVANGPIVIQAADGILFTSDVFNQGEITIDADSNNDGVGDFEIVAGKILKSFDNDISIKANDFIISGIINAGTGNLTLISSVVGSTIGLGNATGDIVISGAELQNITAGSLIVGSALNSGVTVDGVTLADLVNIGDMKLNSGGAVNFSGAGSTFKSLDIGQSSAINVNVAFSTGAGAGTLDFRSSGDINLNAAFDTDGYLDFNAGGEINVNATLNADSGYIFHSGGDINISGDVTTASGLNEMVSGGSISTFGATIISSTLVASAVSGINVTTQTSFLRFVNSGTGDVTISNTGALTLVGSNSGGDLSVTNIGDVSHASNFSFNSITVSGNTSIDATGFDVTLNNEFNDFAGAVSVTGANVTLSDANAIDLGVSTISGTLDVNAGEITASGDVSSNQVNFVSAGDIILNTSAITSTTTATMTSGGHISNLPGGLITATALTISSVTGTNIITDVNSLDFFNGYDNSIVADITVNNVGAIDLAGDSFGGFLSVTAGGDITQSRSIYARGANFDATGFDITLDNDLNYIVFTTSVSGHHVSIGSFIGVDFGPSTITGDLDISVSGSVRDSGPISVAGTTTIDSERGFDIILDNALNDFQGTVSATSSFNGSGGNIVLTDANSIDLGAVTALADFTVMAGGAVTQSDSLTVAGATNISAVGQDVTLNNAANDFIGAVSATGDDVVIWDANDLVVGASTMAGIYVLSAGGNVTQSGALTVAGRSSIFAGQDITLTNAANDFEGISFGGHNVTVVDIDGLQLSGGGASGPWGSIEIISVITGNLSVTAGGDITQLARAEVSGTTIINAAGHDVILDNALNDFTGAVSVTGANVALTDQNAIDLGASTITGTLSILAAGDITQSGALNVIGTSSLFGVNITLNNASNDFQGAVSANSSLLGGNVSLTDINSIDLGASNVNGNLDVTAGGDITDSGNISVSGSSAFIVGNGKDITLDSSGNSFFGTLNFSASAGTLSDITIVDTTAIDFSALTMFGHLSVTAGGAVTQSGSLSIGGTTTINAAGQDITLDDGTNNFNGSVSIISGHNVTLAVNNLIRLGASTISGDFSVTTSGFILQAVTQTGALSVAGNTYINAGTKDVKLDYSGNDFMGSISVIGRNVTLVDSNAIDLGASQVIENLDIMAGGSVTDSGELRVLGITTISAIGQDVTLDTATNDFGRVDVTGANVTLVDEDAIDLGTSNVNGNLSVTAGGVVSNSGALTVAGTTDVNAAGHNVFLNNSANDFGGTVSVDGDFVALYDVNDLELGASTFTNGASIITLGNLTQSGALNTSGDFSVSIMAQDVMLTNANNDFQSGVWVFGNNVSLTDINEIELGTSTINGDFTLTAGGAVTQYTQPYVGGSVLFVPAGTGPLTVAQPGFGTPPPPFTFPTIIIGGGPTSGATLTVTGMTTINAVGQSVILFNDTNDFMGEVEINAGNALLADANSIALKDSTTSGGLIVNANDGVTINGTVTTGAASSFNADGNADGSGTFSVTAAGSVLTNNNSLSITADDFDLAGTLNAGTASMSIRISDNGTIGLGNTAGDMTISGSELQNITASTLNFTGTSTSIFLPFGTPPTNGDITVDGITAANSENIGQVKLETGADVNFINNDSVFNSLDIRAVSDININTNVETDSGEFYAMADSFANGAGTFSVGAAGSVTTNDNLLTVVADDIDIVGTLNAGLSEVRIWISDGGTIGLGNTAGDMTISGAELQSITAANLVLGSTSTLPLISGGLIILGPGSPIGFANSDITVDGITSANSQNIGTMTLASSGNIHFENNDSVFNALNVHAVTDINVNTNLETDTGSFEAIADFELNNIGDFNLASGATVTSAVDIDITAENVNLNGNLNAGGTITINGEIFADEEIFLYAVDGIIITEDINNNEAITIDADTNRDGIGDFELVGGVMIKSNDYNISITANDFIIDGIIDAGLGNVTLVSSVGGTIGVGEAWGYIRIDNYELQNITAGNLIIGDEKNSNVYVKNVQANDVANIAELTLNATKWGKSVMFYGPASNLNNLTANASNDVLVYGGLTAKDTTFNAGDDVKLWGGTYSFDSLTAVADDDIIIYGTLNATNADYTAGDDIWLDGYQTYGVLNANANDDIFIDWELTAATANLTSGDDTDIRGTTRFGDLTVNAGDDISVRGDHETTGTAKFIAGDDVTMRNNLSFGDLKVVAGDYISVYATLGANNANYAAGGDIWLDGYQTYGDLKASAGDDITIDWELTAATAKLTAGDDVLISGTTRFDRLTVNAGDDISVRGDQQTTGKAKLTAGDDIYLNGYNSFGKLVANAGHDIDAHGLLDVDGKATLNAGNDIDVHGTFQVGGKGNLNAGDDIHLHGYNTFNKLTMDAGDDIFVKGVLSVTNNGTLNADGNVHLDGYNSLGKLLVNAGYDIDVHGLLDVDGKATLNAGNDIDVHGTFAVGGKGSLNAGDDIHLHGYNTFGDLEASSWDDININGVLSVEGKGSLNAGDDISMKGYSTFDKLSVNAIGDIKAQGYIAVTDKAGLNAGNDIDVHGTFKVGGKVNLNAGDDIHLHGYNKFDKLTANSVDDIDIRGSLTVTGKASMNAGDDIQINGYLRSGDWTAVAGDDIRLNGYYNVSTADLKANDEIRIDRASINSGNFSAEADYDNNGSGAFKLEKHSSINSTGDIDLSGFGLKIKGSLSAAGTITVTDKSE